jgi:flagellar biosynthesis regulator FlaF
MIAKAHLKQKIKERLDELEVLMKSQTHLQDADKIIEALDGVEKFWSVLNEDEKDFIGAVRYACRTQITWD